MTTYLYCRKRHRSFAVTVADEKRTPQDHEAELFRNNDLVHKEYDRNHPFIGCGYGYCDGKLADFSWWKEELEKAQKQGQAWPVTPVRGIKYEF